MNTVTVNKNDLKKILKKNRDGHRTKFEEALEGYRKVAIKLLDKNLGLAKKGRPFNLQNLYSITEPQDFTEEYDTVIEMLDMEISEEITLSKHEFENYVRDDWGWKAQFATAYLSNTGKVLG